jgi:hypothetical protein
VLPLRIGDAWFQCCVQQLGFALESELVVTLAQRQALVRQLVAVKQVEIAYRRELAALSRLIEEIGG